ncbi:MAG TPA: serine hydrolase domain-containing protein [Candidatus Koribacter sp.]|jgi:CubicO group peptidase (beta-lactamase class C family)
MGPITRRGFLTAGSAGVLGLAASRFTVVDLNAAPSVNKNRNTPDSVLDAFIANYLRLMNAPGITLGTANENGTVRVAAYGYDDPECKQRIDPSQLFHIGSITKSFVALVILQLHEEGKIDLQKPVLEYLPWLPIECTYGAINAHHLLTHTSGLPDALVLFPTDRTTRWQQAWKPGEKFYYSNVAFDILGHLIEALDGRTWPSAAKARVLDRVGMPSTVAVITSDIAARTAHSYVPLYEDRPYPRMGKLARAGIFQFDDAAGSIASTGKDMSVYAQMLLNHGKLANGRIISEDSFALMSKPHIKADEFGPTASYGYGIAVDTMDGHPVLRHTGGMPSFASAILIDLEAKHAAFASINAMQGFRPTQVVQYAVQLMSAVPNPKGYLAPPVIEDPLDVKNAADFTGTYTGDDGKTVEITAEKQALFATIDGHKMQLESAGPDAFITEDPLYARSAFAFGRMPQDQKKEDAPKPSEPKPASPPVIELALGSHWYRNSRYTGPTEFKAPDHYRALTGYYLGNLDGFPSDVTIVIRKGELCMENGGKLVPIGENEFMVDGAPDRLEFLYVVGGKARLMKMAGIDLWRFERT